VTIDRVGSGPGRSKGKYDQDPNLAILGVTHDTSVMFAEFDIEIWEYAHRDYFDMAPLRGSWPRSIARRNHNRQPGIGKEGAGPFDHRPAQLIRFERIPHQQYDVGSQLARGRQDQREPASAVSAIVRRASLLIDMHARAVDQPDLVRLFAVSRHVLGRVCPGYFRVIESHRNG
jgi:hypothetical protein